MASTILDALRIRRDELAQKRKARASSYGYVLNVKEINQAIDELDAEIARLQGSDGPETPAP